MKRSVLVFAVAAALALGSRTRAERWREAAPLSTSSVSVSPRWAPLLSLGFDALVGDLLWIRLMQRIPNRPADGPLGRSMALDLETTVTLDPDFREAYVHGSTLLSVLGAQPCSALAIAQKGSKRFPEDWRLPFAAGYTCFLELSDFECAAREMRQAASMRGSPGWLPGLVARLMSESGQIDTAIGYLEVQYARADDPRLKRVFGERLSEARLTRDLTRLDSAVRTFMSSTHGRVPDSIEDLRATVSVDVPERDPFGGRYLLAGGHPESTSGRKALAVYRRESTRDTPRDRLASKAVVGRAPKYLGMRHWMMSPMSERLLAAAGHPESALSAFELFLRFETDPIRHTDWVVLAGRALLRIELDALRQARLDLLREAHGRQPALEEIRLRAGVPREDPFGSSYEVDESGMPIPSPSREPLRTVTGAGQTHACP